jgi:hypothetical protein
MPVRFANKTLALKEITNNIEYFNKDAFHLQPLDCIDGALSLPLLLQPNFIGYRRKVAE